VMAGGRLRRVDFIYERERVVVEAEGFAFHSYGAIEKDRRRRNAITCKGYRVLIWTWHAVKNEADRLAEELANALQGPS
jgi:very-short-patch-repair endonuclease